MITELSEHRIQAELATKRYGRSLDLRQETDSTNDDARTAAEAGALDGHVVLADRQRAGRGSKGRSWSSPGGLDLYLSILDRPKLSLSALPPLTLAVGLGVADAVEELLGPPPAERRTRVKWPNDVWLDGKKCCGILVEAASVGAQLQHLVIGIGLNVNRPEFGGELRTLATSLRIARGGAPLNRAHVLQRLLSSVERWVDHFVTQGAAPVVEALSQRLALKDERVRCGDVEGLLRGVAPSGAARIEGNDGRTHTLVAGTLLPA